MRKHGLILLALLVAWVSLLSGCHGQRMVNAFAIPEAFDEQRSYEITFWAKNDTNINQTRIYERAISEFEELYPNIHVNLKLYTDYGRIYNDVITNIATGTTPNVCITYPDHIATYKTGENVVLPLDNLLIDSRYGLGGSEVKFNTVTKGEIVPKFLQECTIDGNCYALPYMRSTEACYVNRTYVEKLGYDLPDTLTWDFIWEVSEAAMEKNDDGTFKLNGQKVLIPFIYKSTDNMMIQMLAQKDNPISNLQGEIQLFGDTTKELLFTVAEHAKTGAFSTFKISSYPANFLNAGQCIFAVDSTAGATWMGSKAPLLDISEDKLVDFETAVRMVPQFDTKNPKMISQGPSVCVFNKEDPQEVLASWLFTQYLLTNSIQIAYAETEGYVPVTIKAQNNPAYQEYLALGGSDGDTHYSIKIDATRLLLVHVNDSFITDVFNGSASLRDAAGQMIENTTKSVRRKETVDDAYMDALFSDVISLYRLDQLQASSASDSKANLGPLPKTSVILIVTLCAVWLLLLLYGILEYRKKKRQSYCKG